MTRDPIVDEIRRHREAYAAKFNYDIHEIVKDIQQKQRDDKQKLVRLPPKRIPPTPSTPSQAK